MNKFKKAFSLIELSIVLIIIGILIAGVTGGASLITSSRIISTKSQALDYIRVASIYRARYNAIPGDDSSATQRFSNQTVYNGNSDGYIGGTSPLSLESLGYFQHAYLGGVFETPFTGRISAESDGTINSNDTTDSFASISDINDNGINYPTSKIASGAYYFMYSGSSSNSNILSSSFKRKNMIAIAPESGQGGAVKPEMAQKFDTKFDDGNPVTGKIISVDYNDVTGFTAIAHNDFSIIKSAYAAQRECLVDAGYADGNTFSNSNVSGCIIMQSSDDTNVVNLAPTDPNACGMPANSGNYRFSPSLSTSNPEGTTVDAICDGHSDNSYDISSLECVAGSWNQTLNASCPAVIVTATTAPTADGYLQTTLDGLIGTTAPTEFDLSCDALGYNGTGRLALSASGDWSVVTACTQDAAVQCTEPGGIQTGHEVASGGVDDGNTRSISCASGYTGGTLTATCKSGNWVDAGNGDAAINFGALNLCNQSCSSPSAPTGYLFTENGSNIHGDTISIACDAGNNYGAIATEINSVTCENGDWKNGSTTVSMASLSHCGRCEFSDLSATEFPTINNATIPGSGGALPGSTTNDFTCKSGFSNAGVADADKVVRLSCGANGEWVAQAGGISDGCYPNECYIDNGTSNDLESFAISVGLDIFIGSSGDCDSMTAQTAVRLCVSDDPNYNINDHYWGLNETTNYGSRNRTSSVYYFNAGPTNTYTATCQNNGLWLITGNGANQSQSIY